MRLSLKLLDKLGEWHAASHLQFAIDIVNDELAWSNKDCDRRLGAMKRK